MQNIHCPKCGETKKLHEKVGLFLSLYQCEVCGTEFREVESERSELNEQTEKFKNEVNNKQLPY